LGFSIRWKNLCFLQRIKFKETTPDFQISRKLAALNFSAKLGAFRRQSAGKSFPPNFTEVAEWRRISFR
jgi:hypothetical protein